MQRLYATLSTTACALWCGALIWLFLTVQTLFANDRAIALSAAPMLFVAFERYQLILAFVAILSTAAWYLSTRRRLVAIVCLLLALATLGAIIGPRLFTRPMEQLRLAGESSTPQFRRLHGLSMILYSSQALLLLITTLLLPSACLTKGREPTEAHRAADDPREG